MNRRLNINYWRQHTKRIKINGDQQNREDKTYQKLDFDHNTHTVTDTSKEGSSKDLGK